MSAVKRRLLNVLAGVSLVLCAAILLLWTRCFFSQDLWQRLEYDPYTGFRSVLRVRLGGGQFWIQSELQRRQWLPGDSDGWQRYSGPKLGPAFLADQWCSFEHGVGAPADPVRRWWMLQFRLLPMTLVTALLPGVWVALRLRRRVLRSGVCPQCGYDLRATARPLSGMRVGRRTRRVRPYVATLCLGDCWRMMTAMV
jgi:ribosomal protein L34E